MTATATGSLTIECAKPDCYWRGSPADAPTHPCPTPADDGPVNETVNKTEPESAATDEPAGTTHVHEPRPSFVREREELEEQLRNAGVEFSKDLALEDLRELAKLTGVTPGETASDEAEKQEPAPDQTGEDPDAAVEAPAYDSDPETVDDLARWLAAHGQYDRNGVPADERTATLDARYGVLVQDHDTEEPQLGDETGEPLEGLDVPEGRTGVITETGDAYLEPRPWETVIAEALDRQESVTAYKWLVVWHPADPTREAELIGRGKTKAEATVVQEDVIARGQLTGDVAVYKTADTLKTATDLAAAARVDEPVIDQEETTDATPETEAPTAQKPPLGQSRPPAAQTGTDALFDIDEYADPTLALPQVDGKSIDRIAITFTGEVMLDRSDTDHVALFRRLKLGQAVELWVEGRGLGFAAKGATNKDGELDVVVGKRTISVQHVRVMGPEDLQEAALELASQARDAAEAQDARDRRPDDT